MGHLLRVKNTKLFQVPFARPLLFSCSSNHSLTQPLLRGDYEMALEPEVGFTLSGEALRLCGFYHVLPLQKLRVSQGSLPMGERAADKSDAVCTCLVCGGDDCTQLTPTCQIVEKKKPDATMQGRVMAVLNCEEGFVVTAENYCRIPVLGYHSALQHSAKLFAFDVVTQVHPCAILEGRQAGNHETSVVVFVQAPDVCVREPELFGVVFSD
jgi:hypothetical protein